jgi:hypothetical protein
MPTFPGLTLARESGLPRRAREYSKMIIRATGRTVLRASAGVLALRFAPMRSAATSVQHQSDLFAFRAPGTGNLVFAVVYSAIGSSRFDVHIHTGRKRWAVNGLRPQQTGTMRNRRGEHLFSGETTGTSLGCSNKIQRRRA